MTLARKHPSALSLHCSACLCRQKAGECIFLSFFFAQRKLNCSSDRRGQNLGEDLPSGWNLQAESHLLLSRGNTLPCSSRASLAACQPPRAFGFDVWFRLSSGQAVVAVAWASLTLGARRDVLSAVLLQQRVAALLSTTSGCPQLLC